MANVDLKSLDLDELKSLRKSVDKAILNFEERRLKEARAKIEAEAKKLGYPLAVLVDGAIPKAKSKAVTPPKYRHPENPALTWSGRGRQPGWIKELIAKHGSLDAYRI